MRECDVQSVSQFCRSSGVGVALSGDRSMSHGVVWVQVRGIGCRTLVHESGAGSERHNSQRLRPAFGQGPAGAEAQRIFFSCLEPVCCEVALHQPPLCSRLIANYDVTIFHVVHVC